MSAEQQRAAAGAVDGFVRDLSRRALAGVKHPPSLAFVAPEFGKGWRAHYRLVNGTPLVIELAREGDCASRSANFGYSYLPPRGPHRERLRRLAHALCQRLARADDRPAPPAVTRVPVRFTDDREPLGIYLPGPCDRACAFCETNHRRLDEVPAPDPGEGKRLPVASELDAERDRVRSILRDRAREPERYCVQWSGRDSVGSPLFDESIRLAHELGYRRMFLQSPGSRLVDGAFLDFLEEHSVSGVSITAHAASAEAFDHSAGREGAHALFWRALDELTARDLTVHVEVPCTGLTLHELPELFARLSPYPVPVACFYFVPLPRDDEAYAKVAAPYAAVAEALERARELTPPRRVTITGVPGCVVSPAVRRHFGLTYPSTHYWPDDYYRAAACQRCALGDSCPGALGPHQRAFGPWPGEPLPADPGDGISNGRSRDEELRPSRR